MGEHEVDSIIPLGDWWGVLCTCGWTGRDYGYANKQAAFAAVGVHRAHCYRQDFEARRGSSAPPTTGG